MYVSTCDKHDDCKEIIYWIDEPYRQLSMCIKHIPSYDCASREDPNYSMNTHISTNNMLQQAKIRNLEIDKIMEA
jgi:hypothetical protein